MELENHHYRISQEEHYQGEDWWKWAVWIEGDEIPLSHMLILTYPDGTENIA